MDIINYLLLCKLIPRQQYDQKSWIVIFVRRFDTDEDIVQGCIVDNWSS